MRVVVLPGLDGWAEPRRAFAEALPAWARPERVEYPPEQSLGYDALERRIRGEWIAESTVLVAESFSGPLAIRIAADPPRGLRGLVLVASFARVPVPRAARHLVHGRLVGAPPEAFLRAFLVGRDAPEDLVRMASDAIAAVPRQVLTHRLREAMSADVRPELARVPVPIMAIAGARDRVIFWGDTLTAVRPDIRREVLEAPHTVLQRRPNEAASLVAEWLDDRR